MRALTMILGVAAALGAAAWLARDLPPPRTLTFAAGSEGGGYWRIAERYRDILARDGIVLRLRPTAGSVENAALLAAGEADAALMQGGVPVPEGVVESLGAVFVEPFFVFAPAGGGTPANPGAWDAPRVAAGGDGSGTRAAALGFAAAAGVADKVQWSPLGGAAAAEALLAGEVDAAVFVAPIAAPYLAPLFASERVELLRLEPMVALARRMPDAQVLRLPAGSLTLSPPKPAEDLPLLAMTARLVADADLHPALVDRLVEAARIVHGRRDALTEAGRFPAVSEGAPPMDVQARKLIEEGPSVLRDLAPWWIAAQVERVALVLVPVVLLAAPLSRAAPGLWAWRMRRRVWRYYDEMREIDAEVNATPAEDAAALGALAARLETLDAELAGLKLPASYRDNAYAARVHLDLVRHRLEARRGAA